MDTDMDRGFAIIDTKQRKLSATANRVIADSFYNVFIEKYISLLVIKKNNFREKYCYK